MQQNEEIRAGAAAPKEKDSLPKKLKEALAAAVSEIVRENRTQDTDYFHKTERLLYAYPKLKKQLASWNDYVESIYHQRSKGIVRMPTGSVQHVDIEDKVDARRAQYDKTVADIAWIEMALRQVQEEDGFQIIQMRYLGGPNPDTGVTYTWEEIAVALDQDEHQVRRRKNQLINEIALYLFGADAIVNR